MPPRRVSRAVPGAFEAFAGKPRCAGASRRNTLLKGSSPRGTQGTRGEDVGAGAEPGG